MAKDPAALFYIDKWLIATKEMKADCRGWYLNLVMHQFDKKDLPNDMEELANLADVRVSEYERFKQVFEQVLKHKFKENERGRLENDYAKEIITDRERFKEKRSNAGKISYFSKFMRKICKDENVIRFVIQHTDFDKLDTKDEQVLKQVFEQNFKLFIIENENVIVNKDISSIEEIKGVDFFEPKEQTKKLEICKALMLEFGFVFGMQKDSDKQRSIWQALTDIEETKGLDYFIETYQAYKNYKKLAGEITHGFKGIINGGWDADNWQFKIDNFKHNGKSGKQGKDLTNLSNLTDAILADAGINLSGSNTQK